MIIPILLGIAIIVFITRIVSPLVLEIALIGGILGAVEAWRFWGPLIGLPDPPTFILTVAASMFILWALINISLVLGKFFPPAGLLSKLVRGE